MTDSNHTDSTMTDTNQEATNQEAANQKTIKPEAIQHHLDTQGLICPEPVMLLHRAIRKADGGEYIEVLATDPATTRDIPNFCRHLGHNLIEQTETNPPVAESDSQTLYRYVVQKKLS